MAPNLVKCPRETSAVSMGSSSCKVLCCHFSPLLTEWSLRRSACQLELSRNSVKTLEEVAAVTGWRVSANAGCLTVDWLQ